MPKQARKPAALAGEKKVAFAPELMDQLVKAPIDALEFESLASQFKKAPPSLA